MKKSKKKKSRSKSRSLIAEKGKDGLEYLKKIEEEEEDDGPASSTKLGKIGEPNQDDSIVEATPKEDLIYFGTYQKKYRVKIEQAAIEEDS